MKGRSKRSNAGPSLPTSLLERLKSNSSVQDDSEKPRFPKRVASKKALRRKEKRDIKKRNIMRSELMARCGDELDVKWRF